MKHIIFAGTLAAAALAATAAPAELDSSPAEKAQTQSLNEGGVDGTTASPRVLNGEGEQAGESSTDLARSQTAPFDPDSFISLNTVDVDSLESAKVMVPSGAVVGHAVDVRLADDGTPARVDVALDDGRDVWIESDALKYSPNDRVLLTNRSLDDLEASARDAGDSDD